MYILFDSTFCIGKICNGNKVIYPSSFFNHIVTDIEDVSLRTVFKEVIIHQLAINNR